MEKTAVTFLGACANLPAIGEESSAFVINRRYLIDCGWCGVLKMRDLGIDPLKIEYLFITHRHSDHILGLPQLMSYRRIHRNSDPENIRPLKIAGPAEHLAEIVRRARELLWLPDELHKDELFPLAPGDRIETDDFLLETCAAVHTAPSLAYRFTDKKTGSVVGATGDSQYDPAIVKLMKNADLLIHEACYADPDPLDKPGTHSRPKDAARTAVEAGVKRLAIIHFDPCDRPDKVEAVRRVFPNVFAAASGLTVEIA
ncbi:MAG: MBL fold metallo-hydrolase [Planctomycetes bacterium]|nr:MBL fold metallo-hydrolase [Planctomycetota bacterium]